MQIEADSVPGSTYISPLSSPAAGGACVSDAGGLSDSNLLCFNPPLIELNVHACVDMCVDVIRFPASSAST
jgi:hypothetical protein